MRRSSLHPTRRSPAAFAAVAFAAVAFAAVALAVVAALAACGGSGPTTPSANSRIRLTTHGLRPLDPRTEGSYELWATSAQGTRSLGRFVLPAPDATGTATLELPLGGDASRLSITVEPPGDTDDRPSPSVLLAGPLERGSATLTLENAVTDGRPLERDPGHHSLFTSSNNVELGYPSFENAGLWLFSISTLINKHGTREVKLTPLSAGWIYEGWIVHEPGTPREIWVPYGKFRPDPLGLLTSRDNTGSGLFSGDADFRNGGVEDVPGDEWTTTRVASQLGVALPPGLSVPLALDSVDAAGKAVWYHAITIEPIADEDEPLMTDRPFLLQPYRNPIGAGGPGVPRRIDYQGNDPRAEVQIVNN